MKIQALKTRVFKEGETLLPFVEHYIEQPREESIIVITSKIVALSENRVVENTEEETWEKMIKQESQFALRTKWTWLTIKDKMLMSSAGVDRSNADGKLILLPKDSFVQADAIRTYFCSKYKIEKLGIIITDSRCVPLRAGIVGMAIGYAGFRGIKDYVGSPDIFGRTLELSHVDIPDSLAAAAVLCMGEGNEQQPLALISEIELEWSAIVNREELDIEPDDDLFHPLFENLSGLKL
jgi:F420-0:gamma-glutamyl ligase